MAKRSENPAWLAKQAEIGRRLKRFRDDKNKTCMELGGELGIGDSNISRWETGKALMSAVAMIFLCEKLEISVGELLGEQIPKAKETGLGREFDVSCDTLAREAADLQRQIGPGIISVPELLRGVLRGAAVEVKKVTDAEVVTDSAVKPAPTSSAEPAKAVSEFPPVPVLHFCKKRSPKKISHRQFENVAAGFAGELEQVDIECHVAEYADDPNICILIVKGHSMEPTIKDGDKLAVRQIQPVHLGVVDGDHEKIPLQKVMEQVPQGAIAIMNYNNEGWIVKRVEYVMVGGDWKMIISPDNREFDMILLTHKDSLEIAGIVVGVAK